MHLNFLLSQSRPATPRSPSPTWFLRTLNWTRTPGGSTSLSSTTCLGSSAQKPTSWSVPFPPQTTGLWRTTWSVSTSLTTCGTRTAAWTTTTDPFRAVLPQPGTQRTTGWKNSLWMNWGSSWSSSLTNQQGRSSIMTVGHKGGEEGQWKCDLIASGLFSQPDSSMEKLNTLSQFVCIPVPLIPPKSDVLKQVILCLFVFDFLCCRDKHE